MNVNEILLRIQDQLPRTNYQPAAIRGLIRKIDGIDISERAIFSRAKKIAEAYRRIQQESQILKNLQESRRHQDASVSSEPSSTYLAQLFHTSRGSALETLRMIIHQQIPGHRPDQYYNFRLRFDTDHAHRSQPVRYHPNSAIEALRKLENKQSYEHHPGRKTTSRHRPSARGEILSPETKMSNVEAWRRSSALHYGFPSKTGSSSSSRDSHPRSPEIVDLYPCSHPQHGHDYSTSTKRGLEQPSNAQLTKRPRPNPGAYVFKNILMDIGESDTCSDASEGIDGSEYCD